MEQYIFLTNIEMSGFRLLRNSVEIKNSQDHKIYWVIPAE